jgi:hypothetical protein
LSKSLTLTVATALLLSACCASQAPAPASTVPGPSLTRASNKVDLSGDTIEIYHLYSEHPDCTPDNLGAIRITGSPEHGVVNIVEKPVYPEFPATSIRASCNKKKTPGLIVTYKSTSGYTGPDTVGFEVFTCTGNYADMTANITVK